MFAKYPHDKTKSKLGVLYPIQESWSYCDRPSVLQYVVELDLHRWDRLGLDAELASLNFSGM